MSARETILANLVSEITTITTVNGYATNVLEVLRNVPHSDDLVNAARSVVVVDEGEDEATLGRADSGKMLAAMSVQVRCYVVGASRGTPPTAELGNMIADLIRLVEKPVSLGANTRFAEWSSIEVAVLTDRVGVVSGKLRIVYWYAGSAP